jgi:hypothetical protein
MSEEIEMPTFKMKRKTLGVINNSPSITSLHGSIHMENGHCIQLIDKTDPIGQRENLLRIERH